MPPYVAPGHLYQVSLPIGWESHTYSDQPGLVELRAKNRPYTLFMQIRHLAVGEGARAKQLQLRGRDLRLNKLPHFVLLAEREVELHGAPAAVTTGTYWYQGNIQYPRVVEEMYLVAGQDAFIFHLECFLPAAEGMAGEIDRIYSSFIVRPGEGVTAPSDDDEDDPLDKIPF